MPEIVLQTAFTVNSLIATSRYSSDSFRVIDSETGQPIAGASVLESWNTEPSFNAMRVDDLGPTNSRGEANVVPHGGMVAIDAPGYSGKDVLIYGEYQVCKRGPATSATQPLNASILDGDELRLGAQESIDHIGIELRATLCKDQYFGLGVGEGFAIDSPASPKQTEGGPQSTQRGRVAL